MDSSLKKKLRALSLALRHTLEGSVGQSGDLENRLNQMGVWRDRAPRPAEELQLSPQDLAARRVVDAFLQYREEAGVSRQDAFAEFVRESAYSWANRLFMLRCLESRGLIDEVVLQKEVYGGRSLVHHRFAQQIPEACAGEDDGLFDVLETEFRSRAAELPAVFDPQAPAISLRPSVSALKRCVGLLSGTVSLNGQGAASDDLFEAGDAPGWAYQFWNAEEKDRVFEKVRTQKGAKIEGADLIPATQLYTEPYMVKFLVQNSLGALWTGMYPETKLTDGWEYYVRDADRTPPVQPDPPPFEPAKPPQASRDPWIRPNPKLCTEADIRAYARTLAAKVPAQELVSFVGLRNQLLDAVERHDLTKLVELNQSICEAWNTEWPARRQKLKKKAAELTFLDPACGSGHFLLEAFDLMYSMYKEEGILQTPEEICASILNNNLYGIDIDERAIQISFAALWMHALEHAPRLRPEAVKRLSDHIIAANLSLPRGRAHLEEFLTKHPEDAELRSALEAVFQGLVNANQLGTLLRIEEPVEQVLQRRKDDEDRRLETALRQSQTKLDFMIEQYVMTVPEARDYGKWKSEVLGRLRDHFREESTVSDPVQSYFGRDAVRAILLFEVLARRFDVICANPPYLGQGKCGTTIGHCLSAFVGSADLYAAFIERCLQLADNHGIVGMLSLSNYLNADDYIAFREYLLHACHIQVLVDLSNKTIQDLSNPNAIYFCLAVFSKLGTPNQVIRAFDLEGTDFDEKQHMLLRCLSGDVDAERCYYCRQAAFTKLPGSPIAFKLPHWAQTAYQQERYVEDVADARQGLITGDNDRFLRFRWECTPTRRWVRYAKGGAFRRWAGNDEWVVDWEYDGARLRHFTDGDGKLRSRPQNIQYFGRDGCSWSSQTVSVFAVRRLEPESAFDSTGSSAFPIKGIATTEQLMAVFNTPSFALLYSIIQPGVHFREGYLQNLPFPPALSGLEITGLVRKCVVLQERLQSCALTSEKFPGLNIHPPPNATFTSLCVSNVSQQIKMQVELHELECRIWDLVESALEIPRHAQTTELRYGDEKPLTSDRLIELVSALKSARSSPAVSPWRATQNKVEEALTALRYHPSLMSGAVEDTLNDRVRGTMARELGEQAETLVTALSLSLLGHEWPSALSDRSLWPNLPCSDGISFLTELPGVIPLYKRLVDHFAEKSAAAWVSEFESLTGVALSRWLVRDFFQRHISEFRGRPVAWVVCSRPEGRNAVPVLTSILYYQRIQGILPNLRTKYAGGLRTSFESELRTLENLTQLTTDQSARKTSLGFWVEELKQFQEALEVIESSGFTAPELRHYAITDAMYSLARRWLCRLREALRTGPMPSWQKKAQAEHLHPDFSCWIGAAVAHVDRQCVAVAPEAPASDTPDEHLIPAALAEPFRGRAPAMIRTALEAICREWQSQFDKALIQPLREQMKAAEEEYKSLEDNIENKLRRKDLKSEVKALKAEIAGLAAKSGALASQIQEWRCPDAETWVEWLATQPLYDEFASLDGRRPSPKTVAEFVSQESQYAPDLNDGVRVNIAPLQKAGILARDVLAPKDVDKAIADRAEWRADERRWCRQGILPQPGWWIDSDGVAFPQQPQEKPIPERSM